MRRGGRSGRGNEWLLFKATDDESLDESGGSITEDAPKSVKTGRTDGPNRQGGRRRLVVRTAALQKGCERKQSADERRKRAQRQGEGERGRGGEASRKRQGAGLRGAAEEIGRPICRRRFGRI